MGVSTVKLYDLTSSSEVQRDWMEGVFGDREGFVSYSDRRLRGYSLTFDLRVRPRLNGS